MTSETVPLPPTPSKPKTLLEECFTPCRRHRQLATLEGRYGAYLPHLIPSIFAECWPCQWGTKQAMRARAEQLAARTPTARYTGRWRWENAWRKAKERCFTEPDAGMYWRMALKNWSQAASDWHTEKAEAAA